MLTTTNPPAVRTTLKAAFCPDLLQQHDDDFEWLVVTTAPVADNEDASLLRLLKRVKWRRRLMLTVALAAAESAEC